MTKIQPAAAAVRFSSPAFWIAVFLTTAGLQATVHKWGPVVIPWVFGRHGHFDTVPPLQAAPVISTLPFRASALARQGDLTASIYTDGVRLINADNRILWHDSDFKTEGDAKLIFHSDGFIVASARRGIAAWNRDGMKLWEIERSAMSDRDDDGTVTALASAADGTIYATGGRLRAIDKTGKIRWTFRTKDESSFSTVAVAPDGTIYCGSYGLYAVTPDGALKWTIARASLREAAVGSDGSIYWTHYLPENIRARFITRVSADGRRVWTRTLERNSSTPVLGSNDRVYVAAGALYAFNADGTSAWLFRPLTELHVRPLVTSTGDVYSGDAHNIFAVDSSGRLKWQLPFEQGYTVTFVPGGPSANTIVVSQGFAFEIKDAIEHPVR